MPSVYEILSLPIIGYIRGEEIDFTAFGTDYGQSKIREITTDGIVTLDHKDGTSDAFSIKDMKLNYILDPELSAELTASANPSSATSMTTPEPVVLFTINFPGAEIHHNAQGNLLVVQPRGQFIGAAWYEDNPTPGGIVYGPPPQNQPPVQSPPGGVIPIPPVYYPAPQGPPVDSVSSGVIISPYNPGASQPYYPAYNNPNWGSAPPQNVINNGSGGVINIYYQRKMPVEKIVTTNFYK